MRPASSSKSRCIRAYSGTSERDFGVIGSIVTRAPRACGERSRKVANAAMRCFKFPLNSRADRRRWRGRGHQGFVSMRSTVLFFSAGTCFCAKLASPSMPIENALTCILRPSISHQSPLATRPGLALADAVAEITGVRSRSENQRHHRRHAKQRRIRR